MTKSFNGKCPIWGTPASLDLRRHETQENWFDSPRGGGQFKIDDQSLRRLHDEGFTPANRASLSRYIWVNSGGAKDSVVVDQSLLNSIVTSPSREIVERLDDALIWFSKTQKDISDELELRSTSRGIAADVWAYCTLSDFSAATSSTSNAAEESLKLLEFLSDGKFVRQHNASRTWQLTPQG